MDSEKKGGALEELRSQIQKQKKQVKIYSVFLFFNILLLAWNYFEPVAEMASIEDVNFYFYLAFLFILYFVKFEKVKTLEIMEKLHIEK